MAGTEKTSVYVDRSLVGWAEYLRSLGSNELGDAIDTDVERDFHLIRLLNLPRYGGRLLTASTFIEDIDKLKREFVYEKYFLILIPKIKGLFKHSLVECTDLEVARRFVLDKARGAYDDYFVRISEFETNLYGGSIMCNDGILIVEMAEGLQRYVAYGMTNVISAKLTNLQTSVQYSTANIDERELLWRAIKAIRRTNNNLIKDILMGRTITELRGHYFLKGYFEFAYTLSNKHQTPRLVFWDTKLQEPYHNIQNF